MRDEALLGPWVRRFLLEHVVAERNLAHNTQQGYRDSLCQLLPFVAKQAGKSVDRLNVVDLSAERVRAFLTDTEVTRRCSIADLVIFVEETVVLGAARGRLGLGWAKSHSFHTGQTPVLKYNRQLMMALLHARPRIADIVNARVIPLEDAPAGYADFDNGAAAKFVIDPHGMLAA